MARPSKAFLTAQRQAKRTARLKARVEALDGTLVEVLRWCGHVERARAGDLCGDGVRCIPCSEADEWPVQFE